QRCAWLHPGQNSGRRTQDGLSWPDSYPERLQICIRGYTMSILAVIDLVLSLLRGLLPEFGTTGNLGAAEKVTSEVKAAIEALDRAHGQIVTLQELESLRSKPTW